MNGYFFRDVQMVNKNMKRCLTSLIKETQIKYYLILIRWLLYALKKKQETIIVGKDVEKREPLFTAGGNVKQCSYC